MGLLLEAAPRGMVTGIERSRAMLQSVGPRLRAQVHRGALRLAAGSVDALPFRDACFDGACSVNTIYFWESLETGLSELWRVLAPGGRLVLGFGSHVQMARLGLGDRGFTLYSPANVDHALRAAGFTPDGVSSFTVGRNTAFAARAVRESS